jgi:hypothetical protein
MKSLNRKIALLILNLLMFSLQASAQEKTFDESVLSENGQKAYQALLQTQLFAMDGIDYSGESSDGKDALYELLKEGKAKSILAFKSLVKEATIEGGLYGLVGLKMWRCDCFQAELESFRLTKTSETNKERLRYQSGCIVHFNLEKSEDKKKFIDYLVAKKFAGWAR